MGHSSSYFSEARQVNSEQDLKCPWVLPSGNKALMSKGRQEFEFVTERVITV